MRAHFLTAEATDAFLIIVYRRVRSPVFEPDGFSLHRTGTDTDAAFAALVFDDVWFFPENAKDAEGVHNGFSLDLFPVHMEFPVSISLANLFRSKGSLRGDHVNLTAFPGSKSHLFSMNIRRHQLRIQVNEMTENRIQRYRIFRGHSSESDRRTSDHFLPWR